MKFVMFYHSLVSDWNHGNAHFLRGVVSELIALGHRVEVYEPANGWSLRHLLEDQGPGALREFSEVYPELHSKFYTAETLDLERALDGAEVVIVHEWTDPSLVPRIAALAARDSVVLFHDTHHRVVSDPDSLASLDLGDYDGVLAFGDIIRRTYLERSWTQQAWTWHEAADTRRFHPLQKRRDAGDLVWIGNWGDEERSEELQEFLLGPIDELGLKARIHGVRYPEAVRNRLAATGIEYGGWLANYRVPHVFARFRCTVHVPRRAYRLLLPGIPTIRMFEALACGIPLVTAPWEDCEHLFRPASDYLVANNGAQMRTHLLDLLHDEQYAASIARNGLETITRRHTCRHRVGELLNIIGEVRGGQSSLRSRTPALEAVSP